MPKINLRNNYGGQPTGGRRILPGTYEADDPALMGLADYLVANGHATWVDDPSGRVEVETKPETASDATVHLDLDSMTRDALEAYAQKIGIDLDAIEGSGANGNVLKSDLLDAIEQHS